MAKFNFLGQPAELLRDREGVWELRLPWGLLYTPAAVGLPRWEPPAVEGDAGDVSGAAVELVSLSVVRESKEDSSAPAGDTAGKEEELEAELPPPSASLTADEFWADYQRVIGAIEDDLAAAGGVRARTESKESDRHASYRHSRDSRRSGHLSVDAASGLMSDMDEHKLTLAALAAQFDVSFLSGLDSRDVKLRLTEEGHNSVPGLLPTWDEIEEEWWQSASRRSLQHIALRCRVLRTGRLRDVPLSLIVAGDILLLTEGALVPADSRVLHATRSLRVDSSLLTGDSPQKRGGQSTEGCATRAHNILLAGSSILRGSAFAIVCRTGKECVVAQIDVDDDRAGLPDDARAGYVDSSYPAFAVMGCMQSLVSEEGLFFRRAADAIAFAYTAAVVLTLPLGEVANVRRAVAALRNVPVLVAVVVDEEERLDTISAVMQSLQLSTVHMLAATDDIANIVAALRRDGIVLLRTRAHARSELADFVTELVRLAALREGKATFVGGQRSWHSAAMAAADVSICYSAAQPFLNFQAAQAVLLRDDSPMHIQDALELCTAIVMAERGRCCKYCATSCVVA
eukprot:PLAT7416.2.p1 GENE.PLAT7416.2~~PLAT7416.2.p1  ORF type:complete len:571 (-),score=256.25 PLAT7416.2:173-1885(-)